MVIGLFRDGDRRSEYTQEFPSTPQARLISKKLERSDSQPCLLWMNQPLTCRAITNQGASVNQFQNVDVLILSLAFPSFYHDDRGRVSFLGLH